MRDLKGFALFAASCPPISRSAVMRPMNVAKSSWFLDSNVVLYLLSADSAKADSAEALLKT